MDEVLLSNLLRVLPPPVHPLYTPPSANAWLDVFAQVGSRLPADYVAFVENYGAGEIDDFVRISTPGGSESGKERSPREAIAKNKIARTRGFGLGFGVGIGIGVGVGSGSRGRAKARAGERGG